MHAEEGVQNETAIMLLERNCGKKKTKRKKKKEKQQDRTNKMATIVCATHSLSYLSAVKG